MMVGGIKTGKIACHVIEKMTTGKLIIKKIN